jgi:hypothetical protein
MDVTPASGTVHPGPYVRDAQATPAGAETRVRRAQGEAAATLAPDRAPPGAPPEDADPPGPPGAAERAHGEPDRAAPALAPGPSRASSLLKFDVAASDVLARFQIDEDTNQVIVSMYQRDTGELLREYPPREVLDVMAALAGRGLAVDVQG